MLTITKSGNATADALQVAPNAVEVLRYQITELIRKEAPANFHESMIHWTNKGGDGVDGVELTATWCDSYDLIVRTPKLSADNPNPTPIDWRDVVKSDNKHSVKDRVKQLEDDADKDS